MSSLPPGWTEERLQTITEDDSRQIPKVSYDHLRTSMEPFINSYYLSPTQQIRQINLDLIPLDKIMDKCLMPRFEDPELQGATHQQIQQ